MFKNRYSDVIMEFQIKKWRNFMKRILFTIFMAACFLGLTGCGDDQLESKTEVWDAKYEDLCQRSDSYLSSVKFTGAVLVAKGDKVVFAKGYGLTDSKDPSSAPVSINSNLEIGSITKQFTASAIMQLQEKKLLSVDDKISKYFPDYVYGDKITIKNLLSMRSGINPNIYFSDELIAEGLKVLESGNHLDDNFWLKFMNNQPLTKDPGKLFFYDNLNYVLLGKIVEKVSGKSYSEYVQEHFFDPCKMTHSNLVSGNVDVKAYDYNGNVLSFPDEYSLGAGGMNSSVVDLFRWMQKFSKGKIVSRKSLMDMTINRAKENYEYGYGLRYNGNMIYHDGSTFTYNSTLMYDVATKTTIVVLCNRSTHEKNANSFGTALAAFWK